MSVHFVAGAPPHVASARFRAWSIAEAWQSSDVTCAEFQPDASIIADATVITKLHGGQRLQVRTSAQTIIWDLCDPIWCWMSDTSFKETVARMTALTVSSTGLREQLLHDHGVDATVIPDRLPWQEAQRVHAEGPVATLVWFGYLGNRALSLMPIMPVLKRLQLNKVPFRMHLIDNGPNTPMWGTETSYGTAGLQTLTKQSRWDRSTITAQLCAADIALLPPFPGWWGPLKSDNKKLTAAWCGLPVSDGLDYDTLYRLITDLSYRQQEGARMRAWAEAEGDIRQSVCQWQQLLHWTPALSPERVNGAVQHPSRLPADILAMRGLGTPKVLGLLNALCQQPGTRYLELGSWCGRSLAAAAYGNQGTFIGVDDFRQFAGEAALTPETVRAELAKNLDGRRVQFIEADHATFSPPHPIDVLFIDGDHAEEAVFRDLYRMTPHLAEHAVVVCDDHEKRTGAVQRAVTRWKETVALQAEWHLPKAEGWHLGLWVGLVSSGTAAKQAAFKADLGAECNQTHAAVLIDWVRAHQWTHGVEVGVMRGRTFRALLSACPALHLTGVDIFVPQPDQDLRFAEGGRSYAASRLPEAEQQLRQWVATHCPDRGQLMKARSVDAATTFPDASLDFVFIDGDHLEEGVRADIEAWRPKVRPGGLLCGHDIFIPGVRRAVADLCPGWTKHSQEVWALDIPEFACEGAA